MTPMTLTEKRCSDLDKPTILAITGSLRRDSFNRQLAQTAKMLLAERANFELLDFSDVPLFNQDIEYPAPEAVRRVRAAVKAADGVWFFTPEYNHSFPGVLKNLIDWLSRPVSDTEGQVLAKKRATVSGISAGMTGSMIAQDQLVMLISFLNMRVMNYPRVAIPNARTLADAQGKLTLPENNIAFVGKQADAFLRFIGEK